LVGDGPQRASLENVALRLGVAGRTVFARELPRAALPDTYASADAFLFASRSETQGLVLVEALAAGLPVVAVDTPQTREILGTTGRVVPDDPAALSAALREVLDGRPSLGGSAGIARRFDRGTLGEKIIGLYGSLLPAVRTPRVAVPVG
ncbi:MAG: glycosyltransferase, partial [Candidatus Eremiobacteraeota bacterium]|nr:glycosyltransferase [Candidatus Eremiobacteraeota bacterium]